MPHTPPAAPPTDADPNSDRVRRVAALFPSLLDIGDQALRARVADTWIDAIATGNGGRGWSEERLRALPFTRLAGNTEMRFIEHLNSCARQCIAIARVLADVFGDRVPIDTDTLVAGALLADVGKLLEYEDHPDEGLAESRLGACLRHPFSGVALCHAHRIPPEVMHIVAAHSHEGDRVRRSIECTIFHHADFVDFDIARLLHARDAEGRR